MSTSDDDFQPPAPMPGEAPPDTEPLQPGEQVQQQGPQPQDPTVTATPATPVAPGEGTTQPKPQPASPQRGL
jgi:hypothetical protein